MTSSANAITYTNAKVFTGSGPEDFVSAFTIEDGVFTWTGESEDVTATDAVDLGGATVLPGLLDVHTHPIFMATLADSMTLLQPEVTSLESMLDALRRHPDLGAGPQAWVMGFGYNEAKYPDGAPDRHALDRVSTEQPVFARRADGHTAVCNTFALDLAGITRDTPDPAGGRIVRDASGEPTGVLEETSAVDLVYRVKPAPDSAEIARRLAGLSEHFLEFGLVAVDDLYGNFVDEPLAVTRAAVDQGYRPQSSVFLVWGHDALPALTDADRTGQARVGGVKVFLDGAFSNRTAWVECAYPGSEDHGIITITDGELRSAADWARENGVQMAVHVMGDRGINHLIDLFADEEPWLEDRPSIRFDPSTLFTRDMMRASSRPGCASASSATRCSSTPSTTPTRRAWARSSSRSPTRCGRCTRTCPTWRSRRTPRRRRGPTATTRSSP